MRWSIAAPPIAAGALLALGGHRRRQIYETAMRHAQPLTGRHLAILTTMMAGYALSRMFAVPGGFDGALTAA